jgi:hypothetical protein
MIEVWIYIENYPDYMISNMGRVKSLKFGKEKIMSPRYSGNGHLKITLTNNEGKKDFLVHRLVATYFLPNPNNLPEVNHKDEVKTNNCVENLEWCDRKYNANYGNNAPKIVLRKPVIQYSLDGYMLKVWDSMTDAVKLFNAKKITECCQGKRNKSGGFGWKYYTTDNYLIGKLNNSLMDKGISLRKAS